MKLRRFIAAVLAVLALAAFAGCKKHDKDQTDTTGKNDETVSEDSSESTASVADVNADIKNSRYFLGIDLDGWYHWNQTSSGYQKDTTYTASWTKEYNSRGDLVSYITYVLISEGNFSAEKRSYGYTYNSDGTVKEISMTYTVLATPDNRIISIPNSAVAAAQVVNYSSADSRRVELTVTASYDAPTEQVKAACLEAVAATPNVLTEPAPSVYLTDYGSSAIEYSVRCWAETKDYWDVYYALNENLRTAFAAHGVEMTYDHLNVHVLERK